MTLTEGIVKINSKGLERDDLKRYDKQEKESVNKLIFVTKGKINFELQKRNIKPNQNLHVDLKWELWSMQY